MQTKSDDVIKTIVSQVGSLIDARNKTLETNLKIHIDRTVKANINKAIKASEERQNKRLQIMIDLIKIDSSAMENRLSRNMTNIENRLRADIQKVQTEIRTLRKGVAKKLADHEDKIEMLEETSKTPTKH